MAPKERYLARKTIAAQRADVRNVDLLYRIGIPKQYFIDTQTELPATFRITWGDDHVIHLTPLPADLQQCSICGQHSDKTIGLYDKRICPNCIGALSVKDPEAIHVG